MTDDRLDPAAADGEVLSAYLAGDLDDDTAAALERRLAAKPQLAAQLDALADALVALGGYDEVATPEGYEQRLSERLAAPVAAPTDLGAYRQRRTGSARWLRLGTVAAVLLAGTVMAGTALRSMGGQDAMETTDGAIAMSESAAGLGDDSSTRPSAPVILDDNVEVADEQALRRRYEALPEVQALLGVPRDEATELAMVFADAVAARDVGVVTDQAALSAGSSATAAQDPAEEGAGGGSGSGSAESFSDEDAADDGAGPDAAAAPSEAQSKSRNLARRDPCLAAITEDAAAPLVPVRVETLRYDGRRAISYVLVTSTPDSGELDRTEVWVVRPRDCATIVFQQY